LSYTGASAEAYSRLDGEAALPWRWIFAFQLVAPLQVKRVPW
jgi:hypothetical protein